MHGSPGGQRGQRQIKAGWRHIHGLAGGPEMDAGGQVHGGGARCTSRAAALFEAGRTKAGGAISMALQAAPRCTSDGDGGRRRRWRWRPAALQLEADDADGDGGRHGAERHILGRSGTDGGGLTGLTEADGGGPVQIACESGGRLFAKCFHPYP